ncbi:MAG TPA: hypothetical protein VFT45_28600 [Longimicrobium sp.]|nr:hypothetical protein [Longimicrobium sp.]
MILDLNSLAVESFETDPGASELLRRPRATEDIILCAVGGPTNEVILCAAARTQACLAGSPTNEVILC